MLLTVKNFVSSLNYSWLYFKLQTQILFVTVILLFTLISIAIFGSINTLQNIPNSETNKLLDNISSLLADNILLLLEDDRSNEIIPFCEQFYKTSTSLRYIIYIDQTGINYGIPYNYKEIFPSANVVKKKKGTQRVLPSLPILDKKDSVITIIESYKTRSFLIVGNNFPIASFNPTLVRNQILFSTVIVFLILIIVILTLINITITRPIHEVSQGLNLIATGNFSNQINLQSGGKLAELIGNFNELSRRLELYEEKNREQLKSEQFKLESLITTITDGILLLDPDMQIVLVNKTAIRIFGWKTKTKLVGTTIWDHLPLVLQKKLFVTLKNFSRKQKSVTFDSKLENIANYVPDQLIRITVKIIYDSLDVNKLPIGFGLTIQDRTKEFELDKTQSRFIGNISHELRTPLFNIKSFIETIQEYEYTLSNWQKRYFLDIVNKETNRLTRLVNDILFISRLDSKKEIPFKGLNINEVVDLAIANYQITARDKYLYLHCEDLPHPLNVYANRDLILQVLINLVGNALKFTYPYGEILIRIYALKNTKVRIEVIDTGIGIPDSYQQYIFQRFYRVENEVHTLKGTGLGLSIVNTILTEHKTRIRVLSRYKVGSVFWFDLVQTIK